MNRVLLDASVLLTGPFRRRGWAARLGSAKNECTFVVTEYVLAECEQKLTSAADSEITRRAAHATLMRYVAELGCLVVPEAANQLGAMSGDRKDQPIISAAIANECSTVCTYNSADFPTDGLRVLSPLGLLKQLDIRPECWAEQLPILGCRGSILVMGQVTSLGVILEGSDGTRVFQRDDAMIAAEGKSAGRFIPKRGLPRDSLVAFLFRFHESGHSEAAYWRVTTVEGGFVTSGGKVILTQGKVRLAAPVPRLVFNGNWGFHGAIINLSGVPSYVPDKAVPMIVRDSCLEGLFGSADIRVAMAQREFYRSPTGELLVAFPG